MDPGRVRGPLVARSPRGPLIPQAAVLAPLAGYLLLTLARGFRGRTKASDDAAEHIAAGRGLGPLHMCCLIGGTMFSVFVYLGEPGLAYSRGGAVYYVLTYGLLGVAPIYFFGPRIAELGRSRGYLTQAQFLAGRFPSRTFAVLVGLVGVLVPLPYLGLQIYGAGLVLETLTRGLVTIPVGAAACLLVVAAYVVAGGAAAIARMRVLQGALMIGVAWGLGLYLPAALVGGIGPAIDHLAATRPEFLTIPGLGPDGEPWTWRAYTSASLSGAVALAVWPHLFMQLFAARDPRAVRHAVAGFPVFQLMLVPLILVGFAGTLWPTRPARDDIELLHLLLEAGPPALVVGLVCAAAFAAAMSTGDALLHCASSVAVEDLARPFVPDSPRVRRALARTAAVIVALAVFGYAIVAHLPLAQPVISAYAIVNQLAPPVYAALLWRRATTAGALAGLAGGLATSAALILQPGLRPGGLDAGIAGMVVNVTLLVAVSLATPAQAPEHVAPFLSDPESPAVSA